MSMRQKPISLLFLRKEGGVHGWGLFSTTSSCSSISTKAIVGVSGFTITSVAETGIGSVSNSFARCAPGILYVTHLLQSTCSVYETLFVNAL